MAVGFPVLFQNSRGTACLCLISNLLLVLLYYFCWVLIYFSYFTSKPMKSFPGLHPSCAPEESVTEIPTRLPAKLPKSSKKLLLFLSFFHFCLSPSHPMPCRHLWFSSSSHRCFALLHSCEQESRRLWNIFLD